MELLRNIASVSVNLNDPGSDPEGQTFIFVKESIFVFFTIGGQRKGLSCHGVILPFPRRGLKGSCPTRSAAK
jgi:hypothetical protein